MGRVEQLGTIGVAPGNQVWEHGRMGSGKSEKVSGCSKLPSASRPYCVSLPPYYSVPSGRRRSRMRPPPRYPALCAPHRSVRAVVFPCVNPSQVGMRPPPAPGIRLLCPSISNGSGWVLHLGQNFQSEQNPVIWTISPGFNGHAGPNRRAAMAEHAAGGRTRSPTGLLRSAQDLQFIIPTF